jgi:hypothetical protein
MATAREDEVYQRKPDHNLLTGPARGADLMRGEVIIPASVPASIVAVEEPWKPERAQDQPRCQVAHSGH